MSVPIVDLSVGSEVEVAKRVGDACRTCGFFLIVNHNVDPALTLAAFEKTVSFFNLPIEEKTSRLIRHDNRGYGGLSSEQLDPSSNQMDCKETFNICPDPPGGMDSYIEGLNHTAVVEDADSDEWRFRWPPNPMVPGFRAVMLSYLRGHMALSEKLHRLFAIDLALPDANFFRPAFANPQVTLRLLRYPAPATCDIDRNEPRCVVAGEHTDYDSITLLTTNGVGGLQVRHRETGEWIDVPHVPGAITVNIADCLMRWTNDIYRSTPHRVLAPRTERYSIALFIGPDPQTIISALPTTVNAGTLPKYPVITAGDHLKQRLDATYAFRR